MEYNNVKCTNTKGRVEDEVEVVKVSEGSVKGSRLGK